MGVAQQVKTVMPTVNALRREHASPTVRERRAARTVAAVRVGRVVQVSIAQLRSPA